MFHAIVRMSEMFIYPVEGKRSLAIFWHCGFVVYYDNTYADYEYESKIK